MTMANAAINVNVKDATKSMVVTVRLRGVSRFRIRTKIAIAILRLASWVMPIQVELMPIQECPK